MTAPSTSALSSWNLSPKEHSLLLLQAIPFVAVSVSYLQVRMTHHPRPEKPLYYASITQIFRFKSSPTLRALTYFVTSLQFALALRLSDLTEPKRVLGFLLLPLRKGFDSSLLFVAGGSVPLGILLYKFVQAIRSKDDEKKEAAVGCGSTSESRLTAKKGIDGKVIGGSLIFGLGWGMTGICRTSRMPKFIPTECIYSWNWHHERGTCYRIRSNYLTIFSVDSSNGDRRFGRRTDEAIKYHTRSISGIGYRTSDYNFDMYQVQIELFRQTWALSLALITIIVLSKTMTMKPHSTLPLLYSCLLYFWLYSFPISH